MKTSELAGMTVAELKTLANKSKVALPAGARKEDILKALAKGSAGLKAKVKAKTETVSKVKATVKASTSKETTAKQVKAAPKKKAATKKQAKKRQASPQTAAAETKAAVKKATAKKTAAKKISPARWQVPPGMEEPLLAQERVSFAKYFTGAPEHVLRTPQGELPREYGRERIALLARDPDTAFAYWEVPQGLLEKERGGFGSDGKLCIRIYDVTGVAFDGTNATAYYDQDVYDRIGSWYFDLHRPGRRYCADIGVRASDGRFRTIARSNAATMPRDEVSDTVDESWTMTEATFTKLYGVPGWAVSGLSSQEIQEVLRQRRMAGVTSPGSQAGKAAKRK